MLSGMKLIFIPILIILYPQFVSQELLIVFYLLFYNQDNKLTKRSEELFWGNSSALLNKMANYHVTKDKELDMWKAKREGVDRAAGYYDTQAEAEKAAKRFSANSGGGEVKIHSPNGPIRDSDTVKPGNDPNPPPDKRH